MLSIGEQGLERKLTFFNKPDFAFRWALLSEVRCLDDEKSRKAGTGSSVGLMMVLAMTCKG